MSKRAKEILEVEGLEVLADKGYYNTVEINPVRCLLSNGIKGCVENGITPYIPDPESTVPEDVDIHHKDEFRYDAERDIYICPVGKELIYKNTAMHHGRVMRVYKSHDCISCGSKRRCTRNKRGRIIYRWEHEDVLEDMRDRVKRNKDKVKKRQQLTEHIFGTIKRGFNQGYLLMRGIEKVGAEISLSILVYNIKRAINIVGLEGMIEALI